MSKEFKIKTLAELEEMTAEQKEAYVQEKAKHELEQAKEAAKEVAQSLIEKAKENQEKPLTSKEIVESEEFKTALADAQKAIQDKVDTSLEDISKNQNKMINPINKFQKEVTEKLQNAIKEAEGNQSKLNGLKFTIKDDAADTHTIGDVDPAVYPAGSTANVDASTLITYGQRVGNLFAKPLRKLNLLNYINVQELTGQYLLRDILYNSIGDAEFVPECGIKPIVKEDVKTESIKAGKIALRFRMSEEYQKFVPEFVKNRIMARYQEKLDIAMIDAIFGNTLGYDGIITNAAGFTPDPAHVVFSNPNHLDAIAAAVNSLELRDYMPAYVVMNPADKLSLLNVKGSDQHYAVFNNGSIQLVNGALCYVNGDVYPIEFDKSVPAGSLFIGSQDTVEVAADDEITVRFGYDKDGDFSRNILSVVFEKFVAVSAPSEVGDGLLFDTFDNIKTAITQ